MAAPATANEAATAAAAILMHIIGNLPPASPRAENPMAMLEKFGNVKAA
jgi:hypothetical protein